MGKIAFVFSGQGTQYGGMGKELYEISPVVKKLYDDAEEIRKGTIKQSFEGTAEELKITSNTQPCMYLADLGAALALSEQGINPDAVAGFSLGEIAALAFAGAYTYEDGFKIVTERGILMQKSAEEKESSMAAVLKVDSKTVEEGCAMVEGVYPVNYNSPIQTVVAGEKAALEKFKEVMADKKCRIMDLAVAGGFHSPFMNSAAEGMREVLKGFERKTPEMTVYANKTALPYESEVRETMADQIISPVKWQTTIENMVQDGFDTFIETGVGKVLSGLIKKIAPDVNVYNVEDAESLKNTIEAVKNNG